MAVDALKFGQYVVGLLIDGVEETPYTGATLHMEEPRGVWVEVPYIHRGDTSQFEHVDEWFETQTPPTNMLLMTSQGGVIGLFGVQWRGHSVGTGVSMGKLAPNETLLGRRDGALEEPLTVTDVFSHVDGLREWTRFRGIDTAPETDDDGLATGLLIHVRSGEAVGWPQGEATLSFVTDWRTDHPEENPEGGLNISDWSVLVSRFPTPRPFHDHLVEQRKVLHLLTLVAGQPIHFRRHRVADERIVSLSLAGTILSHPRVELVSSQTVREYAQPLPAKGDLDDLLTRFPDVGPEGMERWATQYESWSRFILPSVGVLGRKRAFTEDVIVSTSMSIEAAGNIIGARDGEEATYGGNRRPVTATYVYRSLHLLDVQWGDIAPDLAAIAKAVANTYNEIKHFDRGEFPNRDVSHIISTITRYIVRLLALHIVDETGGLLAQYREAGAVWRPKRLCEVYRLTITADGRFARVEDEEDTVGAQ